MIRSWQAAAVAAVFAAAACKPESAQRADRAARDVKAEQVDVIQAARAGSANLLRETGELSEAAQRFETQRAARIDALRAQYAVIASQPAMIGTMARELPITDGARGDINDKLHRLQMRLDEMQNLIEGLVRVPVDSWEQRDGDATTAMERLDDARREAWHSLEQAPHIGHNGS